MSMRAGIIRQCWAAMLLLCALFGGCAHRPAATPALTFERALITREHVEEAIKIERALATRSAQLPAEGDAWFAVMEGCSRVLVTAPHATNPTRHGTLRSADVGTGSLAIMLHRLAGATVMYTVLASPSDPNFYDDNAFKTRLADLLAEKPPILLLDLHESHSFRPYDVDFGTMGGKSLLGQERLVTRLAERLQREGLLNLSQDYFAAERNATVTKWATTRGVPAIQLETNATWLTADKGDLFAHRFAQLLQALVRYIQDVGPCAH